MTANQHELGAVIGKLDEQVAKVVRQLDHFERRGPKTTGICPRA
jgi:hypothetical protein